MKEVESRFQETLDLSQQFLAYEAENAFLTTKIAKDPYPSQLEILNSKKKISVISGGNRSGKSHTFCNKLAWDATGLYPDWYQGVKTVRGIDAWVLGKTGENTRDATQKKLFGPDPARPGWSDRPGDEALINTKYIVGRPTRKSQPADALDMVRVRHVPSGTISTITFKSHAMDREALASWNGDRALLDEAADVDVGTLGEIYARLMDRQGQMWVTLCPLDGMTPAIKFLWELPDDIRHLVYLGHDQAKHLTEDEKANFRRVFASNPAALLARTEGKIVMNSGLIFPFPVDQITYDSGRTTLPKGCYFLGGMDVGWRHPTAAVAIAWNKMTDVAYVFGSYNQAEKPYTFHHSSLLDRWGQNMTFMIDPASDQSMQSEGDTVLKRYWECAHPGMYKDEFDIPHYKWEEIPENKRKYIKADHTWQTGLDCLWNRFETGRLLIAGELKELLDQYQAFVWDKDGKGPKPETPTNPYDLMAALRYGVLGLPVYAHRLDEAPPWQVEPEFYEAVQAPEWKPYRAGRS
jgi:hypothetical protein